MISNTSLASFSSAISALRGTTGMVPRAAPTLNPSPAPGASSGGLNLAPASSPRGSMLDISA